MLIVKPDSGRKDSKTGNLCWLCSQDRIYRCFSIIVELSPSPLLKFAILLSLISELMVTCLDNRMVNTHNGRVGAKNTWGNGNLRPPPSLAQAITSILESWDERTELLGSSWPTLLVVPMGQEILPLQLRPPTTTSQPLTHCSLASGDWVQVWAPALQRGVEDPLRYAAATWWR
jgi:hypothetical protein